MEIKSNPYLTILTIIFGLLLLNSFLEKKTIYYICLTLSGIAVFSFTFSSIVEKIWFKLALILSLIIPNILLSLIFFTLLTPLALISKLFRVKSEYKSINNTTSTYFNRNQTFEKESFEKAW
tara:strand:+ start:3458 stop:3823 length:366 start_codon:yes stop_codon:yes gene_type:complete